MARLPQDALPPGADTDFFECLFSESNAEKRECVVVDNDADQADGASYTVGWTDVSISPYSAHGSHVELLCGEVVLARFPVAGRKRVTAYYRCEVLEVTPPKCTVRFEDDVAHPNGRTVLLTDVVRHVESSDRVDETNDLVDALDDLLDDAIADDADVDDSARIASDDGAVIKRRRRPSTSRTAARATKKPTAQTGARSHRGAACAATEGSTQTGACSSRGAARAATELSMDTGSRSRRGAARAATKGSVETDARSRRDDDQQCGSRRSRGRQAETTDTHSRPYRHSPVRARAHFGHDTKMSPPPTLREPAVTRKTPRSPNAAKFASASKKTQK